MALIEINFIRARGKISLWCKVASLAALHDFS